MRKQDKVRIAVLNANDKRRSIGLSDVDILLDRQDRRELTNSLYKATLKMIAKESI